MAEGLDLSMIKPLMNPIDFQDPPDGSTMIPLAAAKPTATLMSTFNVFCIILNLWVCYTVYKRRGLRSSSTAIIIANLACVDVLVTLKDMPMFVNLSMTGFWYFEENWCANYGLTNVIYIIVSVSTLVTITTERYCKLREMASHRQEPAVKDPTTKPVLLGYVIAHTTLSYSLSLLWSKYTFVTRKAFCRIEWPPRQGVSLTFMTSFIFILPVSILIYNILYKNFVDKPEQEAVTKKEGMIEDKVDPEAWEIKAHVQLQGAVGIFLLSWAPYVVESMLSGYFEISPLVGIITACVPLFATSLLPAIYMIFLKDESAAPVKLVNVIIQ